MSATSRGAARGRGAEIRLVTPFTFSFGCGSILLQASRSGAEYHSPPQGAYRTLTADPFSSQWEMAIMDISSPSAEQSASFAATAGA
jgi:hypothetical protein